MTLVVEAHQELGQFVLDAAFTAEHGVTALFGRSGSGKTSLMRVIAGLYRPQRGRVVFDGSVLLDTEKRIFVPSHRRRFGYVFQEPRLFPHLSVRQNLQYGAWFAAKGRSADNLERILHLLGIEHLLPRRPARLSGGEKQRVAIGRALLSSPRLLLMDEPLAALDEARKAEIMPYIERLRDEMDIPIIYVSHSVAEVARLANQVVVIDAGRVEAVGPAADILTQPSISAALDRRETGAFLEGTVRSYDDAEGLATVALTASDLLVPGTGLQVGKRVRLHIPARDVMLATVRPEGISALNILPGRIAAIVTGADGMRDIQVTCGEDQVHARITRLSCDRLGLSIGQPVFAIIKTVGLQR